MSGTGVARHGGVQDQRLPALGSCNDALIATDRISDKNAVDDRYRTVGVAHTAYTVSRKERAFDQNIGSAGCLHNIFFGVTGKSGIRDHHGSVVDINPVGAERIPDRDAADRGGRTGIDRTAVDLRRVAVEHAAGNGHRSGVVDGAAFCQTGRIQFLHRTVGNKVRIRQREGRPQFVVDGAAVDAHTAAPGNHFAVGNGGAGHGQRAGVINGTAVGIRGKTIGQRNVAEGQTGTGCDREDLRGVAAGNGHISLIDRAEIQFAFDRDVALDLQRAEFRCKGDRCAAAERSGPQPVSGGGEGDGAAAVFVGVVDRFTETGLAVVSVKAAFQRFHHQRGVIRQTGHGTAHLIGGTVDRHFPALAVLVHIQDLIFCGIVDIGITFGLSVCHFDPFCTVKERSGNVITAGDRVELLDRSLYAAQHKIAVQRPQGPAVPVEHDLTAEDFRHHFRHGIF